MQAAIICREFGWRYEDYLEQPEPFLNIILDMLAAEAHEAGRKR